MKKNQKFSRRCLLALNLSTTFRLSYLLLPLILVLFILLSSCRTPQATPKATDSGVTPVPSSEITPTPTETPIATPTVTRNKVVLLALAGSDAAKVVAMQGFFNDLAAQDGLLFETQQELSGGELDPATRLVVVLPPDPGLLNLAAANPQVQFLAIGIPGIQAAQNLSAIGSGGERPDQQGFVAGYLAAVLTRDWRTAVVSDPETPGGKAARNGFNNGLIFYCGLCRPAYPPFVQYPVFVDLPAAAAPADFQSAVDMLTANAVTTVYVAPGIGSTSFLEMLAQAGFQIIATGAPPASASGLWIASIEVDDADALRSIWPRWLAGEQALHVGVPLTITQRNPVLFSPGRQRLVDQLLDDLLAGFIDTGIDPTTGEPR